MKIFTPCWGEKHIDLLDKCLGRSLRLPKNNLAMEGCEWIFCTSSREEGESINKIARSVSGSIVVKIYSFPEILGADAGIALMLPLKEEIRLSILHNNPMLMATTDFIFSDGTLDALKTLGADAGSCVSLAHIRVLPEFLNENIESMNNARMVSSAFRHAHVAWRESEKRFHMCGIKRHVISEKLQAVQHYMPSPFFCNFVEKDLEVFSIPHEMKPPGFGMWDHVWPTYLISDGRLRYVGSSDLALLLEITEDDKNVPPLDLPGQLPGFFKHEFHNSIQKQFISVFRAE